MQIKPNNSLIMLFKRIWLLSDKKSCLTNINLQEYVNTPFFLSCFAHVLPKRKNAYPYFKMYAGNIVLLTPQEHFLYDQGTEQAQQDYKSEIYRRTGVTADWNKLKEMEISLKNLYQINFPAATGIMINSYSSDEVDSIINNLNSKLWKN